MIKGASDVCFYLYIIIRRRCIKTIKWLVGLDFGKSAYFKGQVQAPDLSKFFLPMSHTQGEMNSILIRSHTS